MTPPTRETTAPSPAPRRSAAVAAIALAALALASLVTPALAQSGGEGEQEEVRRVRRVVVAGEEPAGEDGASKRRRVVAKVVSTDGSEPRLVYVSDDGEPSVVGAFPMRRGFLGVALLDITPELRSHYGASQEAGVLVSKVEEGSPAAAAGLRVGDLLTAVEGEPVRRAAGVVRAIGRREGGEAVSLEVLRDGSTLTLTATLAERERPQLDVGALVWRGCDEEREDDCQVEDLEVELEGLPALGGLHIDGRALGEAMRELRAQMASPEWRERMDAFRLSREELVDRLKELEKRLAELERQLAAKGGGG